MKRMIVGSVAAVLASIVACGVARNPVTQYHDLITAYQDVQQNASSFRLCVDTAMGTIFTQANFLQNYQKADVQKAEVWRKALDDSSARLADSLANYRDANGQPLPAERLDLAALASKGALPSQLSGGLGLFVRAFQEAPLAQVSDRPVLAAMNTATEQYNHINACGQDWNTSVRTYNVERQKIPGAVVGRLAQELGVNDLPWSLPFYTGDYIGSVSRPELPR